MPTGTSRLVEVPPERLARWVDGFGQRHGRYGVEPAPDVVRLVAPDGAVADLEVPWPPLPGGDVGALVAHAAAPRTALVLLVRRGGFAVGLARDGTLLDSAVGTRYVQGRTAAGGWSQQRYARRRRGQAAVLGDDAADAVRRVLDRCSARPDVVVPGGDRLLVAGVLDDPRAAAVRVLPRGPLLDVRDPRRGVLEDAARRVRAVRVRVSDPGIG